MNRNKDLVASIGARLAPERRAALKQTFAEPLAFLYRKNLPRLAQLYGSDKWGHHWYCEPYQSHFSPLRKERIILLEIGIGGYGDPKAGGESLRMWRRYFPNGQIVGIDIEDKTCHNESRIRTFQGDQGDEAFLKDVIKQIGTPDIIIDDGSHLSKHVIKTFECLFPLLSDHGIYAIEDTQTSYWAEFGGSSRDLNSSETSMGFLKSLTDRLNHTEFRLPGFAPSYVDTHILSLHFYHNLVLVRKCRGDFVAH